METQKAIALVAEILDVLVGHFNPDCGGDFKQGFYCKGCEFYHQCKQGTEARELNSKLQSLLVDEKPEDVYDIAYRKGFHDAHGGFEDNPYDSATEPELYGLYERGNIDGA